MQASSGVLKRAFQELQVAGALSDGPTRDSTLQLLLKVAVEKLHAAALEAAARSGSPTFLLGSSHPLRAL